MILCSTVCHIATGLAVGSMQEKMIYQQYYKASTTTSTETAASSDTSFRDQTLPPKQRKQREKELKKAIKMARKNERMNKKNKKTPANAAPENTATSAGSNPPAATPAMTPKTLSSASLSSLQSNISSNNHLWANQNVADNAWFFQTLFEVGRRNKVLNPASMRTTYGKLMYLLQDAQNPTVAKSLGFTLHKELVLVHSFLQPYGMAGEQLLADSRLECAIQYIPDRDVVSGQKLPRDHVSALMSGKQRVTEELVNQYGSENSAATAINGKVLSKEDVRRVIESLADAVAYTESNVRPVQQMIRYLEQNFDMHKPTHPVYSLSLRGGGSGRSSSSFLDSGPSSSFYSSRYGYSAYGGGGNQNNEGPTLSHNHSTQYTFVYQSLRLWCKVMYHMHRLWICADADLLSTSSSYNLYNTGQGLNRVQHCPGVRKVMSQLLSQTQQESNHPWVGLSVIHLVRICSDH
jgi:Protein of unknown function (DUF2009)